MSINDEKLAAAMELANDPIVAHRVIFSHRHDSDTPDFHEKLIELYHDENERNVIALCFRGGGKSTLAEETIILLAASGRVKNVLIVGESWTRATERLRAIRRELEGNTWIQALYGSQVGETWSDGKLILANGTAITAHGQGMALRGMKHDYHRPDLCFVDDLESQDTVGTEEARRKLSQWFWKDLSPINPLMRILIAATPLDPKSLVVELSKIRDADGVPVYKTLTVPIEHVDEEGERQSAWPAKFPLDLIDSIKSKMVLAGKQSEWASEYMVQAVDPSTRLFRSHMFKFEPSLHRTWEPVYVAYDPARTAKSGSATTGFVAASWVGRRLVIWEAKGQKWQPTDLIEDVFRVEAKYEPVAIGVEKDGLSEWIEQPLRHEQIRRSTLIPLRALKAPKDKLGFIQKLQPLFAAGDIVFAGTAEDFSDTIEQFMSYPSGLIDIPNAFAYLLDPQMKSGIPVYEDAYEKHIADDLALRPGPIMLAVNSGAYGSTAVLFQYKGLVLTILQSWADSGDAGQVLPAVMEEAKLYAGRPVTVITPPEHFEDRNSLGLRAACRGLCELRRGGDTIKGREVIRNLFRSETQGCPRILLGPQATWARRAFFGGYSRPDGRSSPNPGLYATMIEGIESAMAGTATAAITSVDAVAHTPDGRAFKSAEARRNW